MFNRSDHLKVASNALKKTRKQFILGAANIAPISKAEQSDHITITPSLFKSRHTPTRRNLDALIDNNLTLLAGRRIDEYREKLVAFIKTTVTQIPTHQKRIYAVYDFLNRESKITGAGHCAELSAFAFFYLLKEKYDGQLELATFIARDHDFIILNRPQNSNPSNWKTWGKDTIILDPWLNKVFTADQFEAVWRENIYLTNPKSNIDPLTIDSMEKLLEVGIKFDQDILSAALTHQPHVL